MKPWRIRGYAPLVSTLAGSAALIGLLGLAACSSLKTASLRDARTLEQGETEISGEISTAATLDRPTFLLAYPRNKTVRAISDSLGFHPRQDKTVAPLLGGYFSYGMAHGWEANAGFSARQMRESVPIRGFKNHLGLRGSFKDAWKR